jgi:hypothetical protein
MVRVLQSSEKRKRDSASEKHEFDSDTIAVIPRQAVAGELPSKRRRLRETQSQANVTRRRTTSRVHGKCNNISLVSPMWFADLSAQVTAAPALPQPSTPSQSPPHPVDNVPASCCYFCRGRGGNADQECIFTTDDPRCTRCIRDKKNTCRPATAEEVRTFAARCERCKIRGFKQCNGQRPHCDTCERNNTQHLCWRPRLAQANAAAPQIPTAVALEPTERPTPIRRPSRKRRRVEEVEEPVEDTTKDQDADIKDRATTPDSELGDHVGDKGSSTIRSSNNDKTATSEEILMDDQLARVDAADKDAEDDVDSVMGAGFSRSSSARPQSKRAMSTDATSVTEDDEAQIQKEARGVSQVLLQESGTRSRRSRSRTSYVQPIPDIFSDQESEIDHANHHDSDSDVYESSASAPESVLDEEFDFEDITSEQSSAGEQDSLEEVEEPTTAAGVGSLTRSKYKPRVQKKSSNAGEGKGIDFNLPPIDSVEDAFADIAAKAMELGLDDALEKLKGRRINVATMCSGTESPLLAFDLLSKALVQAGQQPLIVHQKFAVEIEVFKQAFIERNQSPEIIFRDVREFIPDDATTAITAYGAEEPIPCGLDVLIAGFVCKDLSRLNTQPKGLEDNGESGDTWRAIYAYVKRFRPSIVLLENVKGLSKLWDGVVSMWDSIDYEAAWLIRDTKRYCIPQTRERMYMIAIERSHFGKDVKKAVVNWQDLMDKLQRQCSSPYEAWLKNMLHGSSEHSALGSEVDWALCKLRYDHIRSDERLGILRPVTQWSENGTLK